MEATVTAVSWRQGHRQRLLQRLTRRLRVSREILAGMQFFDVPQRAVKDAGNDTSGWSKVKSL